MKNFESRIVAFLIEHQINPSVIRTWNDTAKQRLDNLINECNIPEHSNAQHIYYWFLYHNYVMHKLLHNILHNINCM
jgi:hypothetical protein